MALYIPLFCTTTTSTFVHLLSCCFFKCSDTHFEGYTICYEDEDTQDTQGLPSLYLPILLARQVFSLLSFIIIYLDIIFQKNEQTTLIAVGFLHKWQPITHHNMFECIYMHLTHMVYSTAIHTAASAHKTSLESLNQSHAHNSCNTQSVSIPTKTTR